MNYEDDIQDYLGGPDAELTDYQCEKMLREHLLDPYGLEKKPLEEQPF